MSRHASPDSRTRSRQDLRFDVIITRITADLADDDPRTDLVPRWVGRFAAELERAHVHDDHLPLLVESAVRRALARPHAAARARWHRRTPCELRLSKWDGSPGRRTPLVRFREDEFGRWYRWPAGEPMLPRSGPPRAFLVDFVQLVPWSGSWTARWGDDGEVDLYCDVTTPPVIGPEVVTAVDLDLDVVRDRSGSVAIIDQEQFAQRRTEMGYPPAVAEAALATAAWLYAAVSSGREPFGSVGAAHCALASTAPPGDGRGWEPAQPA